MKKLDETADEGCSITTYVNENGEIVQLIDFEVEVGEKIFTAILEGEKVYSPTIGTLRQYIRNSTINNAVLRCLT